MSPSRCARPAAASPLAMSAVAALSMAARAACATSRPVPAIARYRSARPRAAAYSASSHQPLDGVGHRPIAALDELALEQVAALHELVGRGDHEPLVVERARSPSVGAARAGPPATTGGRRSGGSDRDAGRAPSMVTGAEQALALQAVRRARADSTDRACTSRPGPRPGTVRRPRRATPRGRARQESTSARESRTMASRRGGSPSGSRCRWPIISATESGWPPVDDITSAASASRAPPSSPGASRSMRS